MNNSFFFIFPPFKSKIYFQLHNFYVKMELHSDSSFESDDNLMPEKVT